MNTIASERKRLGISQKQLAESIGVSLSTVARWEQGLILPYGSNLIAMHDLFHCSTDYLLGLSDERKSVA